MLPHFHLDWNEQLQFHEHTEHEDASCLVLMLQSPRKETQICLGNQYIAT